MYFKKVIYNKEPQKKFVEKNFENALRYADVFEGLRDVDYKGKENIESILINEFEGFTQAISSTLSETSCYFKNPAFNEEKEVRIYHMTDVYTGYEYLPFSRERAVYSQSLYLLDKRDARCFQSGFSIIYGQCPGFLLYPL